ncbi:hypothetical protein D9M68_843410 [compost metagenome]
MLIPAAAIRLPVNVANRLPPSAPLKVLSSRVALFAAVTLPAVLSKIDFTDDPIMFDRSTAIAHR